MYVMGLLNSALSRANGLAATFESLERGCSVLKLDTNEPLVKTIIAEATQRTERDIIDALDELDGEALTKTLWALDELRNARDAFSLITEDRAVRANQHARKAVSAMFSVINTINIDTTGGAAIKNRQS